MVSRLSDAREHIQEQKAKLQVLHTTIAFQEQNLKDFEDRYAPFGYSFFSSDYFASLFVHPCSTLKSEAQTTEQVNTIQALRDRLQELEAREAADALKRERLLCERDAAANRVRTLESEVGDARRRIGERDEKLASSIRLVLGIL
jgi:chromosome segregation ATPase